MTMKSMSALLASLAITCGTCPATEARAAICEPQGAADIVAVQASSALSVRSFTYCVAFDRLVTPPTVSVFTIPKGKVFVMTSVDWTADVPSLASRSVPADFFVVVGGGVNGPSATGLALADSNGVAGGTVTFPTGVVVKANQQLCIAIQTVPDSNQYAPADAVAHGYFAADSE
jgi:hypothetical protein